MRLSEELPAVLGKWKKQTETGAFAILALYFDAASAIFNHAFEHVEPEAAACHFGMKTLESSEKLLLLLLAETPPVVCYLQHNSIGLPVAMQPYNRRPAWMAVFDRIQHKVVEDAAQTCPGKGDFRYLELLNKRCLMDIDQLSEIMFDFFLQGCYQAYLRGNRFKILLCRD